MDVEETQVEVVADVPDSTLVSDSLVTDSTALAAIGDDGIDESVDAVAATDQAEEESDSDEGYSEAPQEEVIHGYVAKKKITKTYSSLTGIGSLFALGSVGGPVFSSGIVLVLTGLVLLIMTLASILLPAYTLFGLFGLKGTPDQQALKLKTILKLNWAPLLIFVFALAASFVGANYGFEIIWAVILINLSPDSKLSIFVP